MKRLLLAGISCALAFLGGTWFALPSLQQLANGTGVLDHSERYVPSEAVEPLVPLALREEDSPFALAGANEGGPALPLDAQEQGVVIAEARPADLSSAGAQGSSIIDDWIATATGTIPRERAVTSEPTTPARPGATSSARVANSDAAPSTRRLPGSRVRDLPTTSSRADRAQHLEASSPGDLIDDASGSALLAQLDERPAGSLSRSPQQRLKPSDAAPRDTTPLQGATPGSTKNTNPWEAFAKTTGGRPLHRCKLGSGAIRVLVIAGLSGTDRVSVVWMDELARELGAGQQTIRDREILLIRAANPDGLLKSTSYNARGVDLNKNFPAKHFRLSPSERTGGAPSSETETQELLSLISQFEPQTVVTLNSSTEPTRLLVSALATPAAMSLESIVDLTAEPLLGSQLGGSIEDYADSTLDAAVVRLELNIGDDWRKSWATHRELILAALQVGPRGEMAPTASRRVNAQPTVGTPVLPTAPATRRLRGNGYEELPPPPL